MNEPPSPTEQDILVSRLINRISELEERLYKQDLESPAVPTARQELPVKPKDGLLSAFKESWRSSTLDRPAPVAPAPAPTAPSPSDWFFSMSKPPQPASLDSSPLPVYQQQQQPSVRPMPAYAGSDLSDSDDEAGVHAWQRQQPSPSSVDPPPGTSQSSLDQGSRPSPPQQQQQDSSMQAAHSGGSDFELMPTPVLQTPLVINGVVLSQAGAAPAQTPAPTLTPAPASTTKSSAQEWLSSLFASRKQQQQAAAAAGGQAGGGASYEAFSEKAFEARLKEQGRAMEAAAARGESAGSYYRYVFDPVDVEAEMEVTARVRKAAAEALMEAEEKLKAAHEVQAGLRRQLEEAMQLQRETEQLRQENEEALRTRKQLEDQMIGAGQKLDGMEQASLSLQQELEGLREQREIWKNSSSNEQDKLKAENALLRSQLHTRLNDLQLTKNRLGDAEADKQRMQRDLEDQATKLQWLQRINSQLESSAEQLEHFKKAAAGFQERFIRERNVRRKLHEQLQRVQGNMRLMCRVRPSPPDTAVTITYPLEGLLCINPPERREQEFEFDHVFPPEASQEDVYQEVSSLVRSCADGHNVCIFAYGQGGSGKTFTIEGTAEDPGLFVRSMVDLLNIASEECSSSGGAPSSASTLSIATLEVYNEAVYDLLRPSSEVGKPLEVSALGPGALPSGTDRVQGITWRPVSDRAQVQQVLDDRAQNRAAAGAAFGASSSRSHVVLSARVELASDSQPSTSYIHMVDLAGSERLSKSEASEQAQKEARHIGKSLGALGDVVSALQRRTGSRGGAQHVPFRNSKLTQVLQDALCGSSKVLLICNVSPELNSVHETLASLQFAARVAQVELASEQPVRKGADRSPGHSGDNNSYQSSHASSGRGTPGSAGMTLKPVRSSHNISHKS